MSPQPSDVEPENAATEITPKAEVTPPTEVTRLDSPNTTHRVHQTFSPPSFLGRNSGSVAANSDHASHSQQRSFTPPMSIHSKSASSAMKKDRSRLDDEGSDDSESKHRACGTGSDGNRMSPMTDNAQDAEQKPAFGSSTVDADNDREDDGARSTADAKNDRVDDGARSPTADAENDRVDDGARSPLKPCNITKKFQSPLESPSQFGTGNNHSQSAVENRKSSTVCHFRAPNVQSGRRVNAEPECAVSCGYFSVVWCKLSKKKVN